MKKTAFLFLSFVFSLVSSAQYSLTRYIGLNNQLTVYPGGIQAGRFSVGTLPLSNTSFTINNDLVPFDITTNRQNARSVIRSNFNNINALVGWMLYNDDNRYIQLVKGSSTHFFGSSVGVLQNSGGPLRISSNGYDISLGAGPETGNMLWLFKGSGNLIIGTNANAITESGARLQVVATAANSNIAVEAVGSAKIKDTIFLGTGQVIDGNYTPTGTNGTNMSAVIPNQFMFSRVRNTVTVTGSVLYVASAASTLSTLRLSLPVPSNFINTGNAHGLAYDGSVMGKIVAVNSTQLIEIQFTTGAATTGTLELFFQYVIF